jgi:hypothetical protein
MKLDTYIILVQLQNNADLYRTQSKSIRRLMYHQHLSIKDTKMLQYTKIQFEKYD